MGEKETMALAKAKRELEELYLGVPDDSVNLTFQDLAQVQKQQHAMATTSEKKHPPALDPISETNMRRQESPPFKKMPSLDFSRGLEASATYHRQNNHQQAIDDSMDSSWSHLKHQHHHQVEDRYVHGHGVADHHHLDHHGSPYSPQRKGMGFRSPVQDNSRAYIDDMSYISGMSMASTYHPGRNGRRRPGIPHSNICTICSTYIYLFRHRCLVCGRVYCKQCVSIGMGEMTEGRKCIECLGRRFSQRYIQRAGQLGCCMGYPSNAKLQELKWAEKGPRRSGENRHGRSTITSRSRSPVTPRTPTRAHTPSNPPSFVMSSPYSAYSPTNHPLPF